eukprot:TRINITY_DN6099_c0_g1_i1.p1 TRINITY_DN6099_c0_g1~~TRINITY_DN6099_c0_g1_i1.p1  ORF type:complete len:1251 (-),score=267.05 TRINITY_DN6099_c0_g1_i1:33-3785(-)
MSGYGDNVPDTALVPSVSTSTTDGDTAHWTGATYLADDDKNGMQTEGDNATLDVWADTDLSAVSTDPNAPWPFFLGNGGVSGVTRLSDAQQPAVVKTESPRHSPPPTMTVIGARPSQETIESPEEQWACIYSAELETAASPIDAPTLSFQIPSTSSGIRGQYGKHSHGRQYELKGFPPVTVTLNKRNNKNIAKVLQSLVISHRVVKSKCTFRPGEEQEFTKEWSEPTELFRGSTTLDKFCTKEVSGKGFRKTDFHVEVAVFNTQEAEGKRLHFLYTSPPFFVNTRGAKDRAARRAKRHASLAATAALTAAQGATLTAASSVAAPLTSNASMGQPVVTMESAVPESASLPPSLLDGLVADLWSVTLHISPTTAKAGVEMLFVGDQDFPANVAIKFGALTLEPLEMIPGQRRVLKLLHIPLYQMAMEGLPPRPDLPENSVPVAVTNADESKCTNSVVFTYDDLPMSDNPLKRRRNPDDDRDDDDEDDDDTKRRRLKDLDNIEACLRSTYQMTEANNHVMRYINAGTGGHEGTHYRGSRHADMSATLSADRRVHRSHSDNGQVIGRHGTRISMDTSGETRGRDNGDDDDDDTSMSSGEGGNPVVDFNLVTFSFRLARAVARRRGDTHNMVQTKIEAILCQYHDGRLDGCDKSGFTLLSLAAMRGLRMLARLLCELGASPDDLNQDGTCAADLVPDRTFFSMQTPILEDRFYGTVGPQLSDSHLVARLDDLDINSMSTQGGHASEGAGPSTAPGTSPGNVERPTSHGRVTIDPTLPTRDEDSTPGRPDDDMFVRRRQRNMSVVGFTPLSQSDRTLATSGCTPSLYSSQYVMDLCGRDLDNVPDDPSSSDSGNVKKVVGLSHNRLTSFPHFSHPGAVEMLLLNHNKIGTIPESIGEFTKLRKLWLQHNMLGSVPVHLTNLSNLRSLYLHHNKLTSLPSEIGNLKQLEKLIVDNNQLTELPESLGECKRLSIISAVHNQLQHVPDVIVNLTRLSELHLSHNQIEDLPNLEPLKNLHALFLEYNCLSILPEGISGVKDIGLAHNEIQDLCGISQLKHIKSLNLNFNLLRDLPAEIGALSGSLEEMALHGNQLRDVQNICLVKSLTSLDVSANQLVALPADLRGMKSLRRLDISGNPLLCEWEVHPEVTHPVVIPSLLELAARTVYKNRILASFPEAELPNILSMEMIEYMTEARSCHVCKGPYFPPLYEADEQYGKGSINFTFFSNVGGSRVPLSFQLCSHDCRLRLQRGYILLNGR